MMPVILTVAGGQNLGFKIADIKELAQGFCEVSEVLCSDRAA